MNRVTLLVALIIFTCSCGRVKSSNEHCEPKQVCPPGKVYSPLYEGGTCICPEPLGVNNFVVTNLPFVWDVIACKEVLRCNDDYIYDSIRQECVCNVAKIVCDREYILNVAECKCVKNCSKSNTQCAFGYHYNYETCQCIKNQCTYNTQCPPDHHFDIELCTCINGAFCKEALCCPVGKVYDNNQCKCVNVTCFDTSLHYDATFGQCVPSVICPPCPEGLKSVNDTYLGCTCQCPYTNQVYNPITKSCVCLFNVNCSIGFSYNLNTCNCTCDSSLVCGEGYVKNEMCQCVCPALIYEQCSNGIVDINTCQCKCNEGYYYDLSTYSCQFCRNPSVNCYYSVPPRYFDYNKCTCSEYTCCNVTDPVRGEGVFPYNAEMPCSAGGYLEPHFCTCLYSPEDLCGTESFPVCNSNETFVFPCNCVKLCPNIISCPPHQSIDYNSCTCIGNNT